MKKAVKLLAVITAVTMLAIFMTSCGDSSSYDDDDDRPRRTSAPTEDDSVTGQPDSTGEVPTDDNQTLGDLPFVPPPSGSDTMFGQYNLTELRDAAETQELSLFVGFARYHLNGDPNDIHIWFFGNSVYIELEDETIGGTYEINGNNIKLIHHNGDLITTLTVEEELSSFIDSAGDIYRLEKSNSKELFTESVYYINGSVGDYFLFFFNEGYVKVSPDSSEFVRVDYTVSDDKITIDGVDGHIQIINSRILDYKGYKFILVYVL
jgi:hypothetical protein